MTQQQSRQSEQASGTASEYAMRSIDFSQTLLLTQTVQVAVGLFSLPRVVAEQARHDGWMAIPIAGVITQAALVVIILLMRRFSNQDLYAILRTVYGKWIGRIFGGVFALYCIAVSAIVTRTYIELVQTWLFPTTTPSMFFLLLVLPCVYVATGGARVLGRFGVMTFFVTIWMTFLLAGPLKQVQVTYYFPLFDASFLDLMKATYQVSASAVGFELVMVYYPYIQKKQKAMLSTSLGIWTTYLIYLAVTLVAIGFYSEKQLTTFISPSLHMFKIVELPLIERLEHIGIVTWSFLIVNTAGTYLWAAGRFLKSCTKWKEPNCIYVLVPLLIVLGLFPQDVFLLDKFEVLLGAAGAIISVAFPAFVLLSALILRKKGGGEPPATKQKANQEANAS
ncbi:MAG: GerAB/ArcD/ProY family transporter [Tumebacillaceae bacterium]